SQRPTQSSTCPVGVRLVRSVQSHEYGLVFPLRIVAQLRDDRIWRVDLGKALYVDLGIAIEVEQAVAFPVSIGNLGDYVPGQTIQAAHNLNLKFHSTELVPLRRLSECLVIGPQSVQAEPREAFFNTARPAGFAISRRPP